MTPAINHLLRRAAADAKLQATAGDQIRRPRVFGHIERIFIAHIDNAGADFNPAGFRAYRGQQRKRRAELAGKMMHPKIGAVRAQLFGGNRQIDGLQQRISRRAGGGLRRRRPVAK